MSICINVISSVMEKKSFINYLLEIQISEVCFTGNKKCPMLFNQSKSIRDICMKILKNEIYFLSDFKQFTESQQQVILRFLYAVRDNFVVDEDGKVSNSHIIYNYTSCGMMPSISAEMENMIQEFIIFQYTSIVRVIDNLSDGFFPGNSAFRWNSTITSLTELAYALFRCKFVLSIDGKMGQRQWIEAYFRFLHVPVPNNINQLIYKINNRQERERFLKQLTSFFESFSHKE